MSELNFEKVDLGAFGIQKKVVDQGEQELQSTMSEAFKINPDNHAKNLSLSQQSGMPEFAVESDPESVQSKLNFDNVDFNTLSKRNPKTAGFYTDFNNAAIAHDEIDLMAEIEDIFDVSKTFEGFGESVELGFEAQAKGAAAFSIDRSSTKIDDLIPPGALPLGVDQYSEIMSREFANRLGVTTDEEMEQAKNEAVENIVEELKVIHEQRKAVTPEDLNTLEQGVRAGFESLVNMAPGIALGVASGGGATPVLLTIGTQTFADSYGGARAEGLTSDEATFKAGIDAAIEVGTEILPVKTLETIITGTTKGLTKKALKFAVQEMGTEQLATLGQSLNDYAFGLDEQMEQATSIQEMVDIQLQRQAVTAIATVVTGGAQAAAATGLNKTIEMVSNKETQKETQAEADQRTIDAINETTGTSKTRGRNEEVFKQFIEESAGESNTHVFLDSTQTALYLGEKSAREIEADPALKVLSEAVNEAGVTGADAQVKIEDFASVVTGTEHFTALREFMTLDSEISSPFREEQSKVETENYLSTLLSEAEENASEFIQAQEIFTTVRDQLIDTGQVAPQAASTMAQVVPAWATVHAKRNGITVEQAYRDSGLVIEGPQTGERDRLDTERLEQTILPAFKESPAIFENIRDDYLEVFEEDSIAEDVIDNIDELPSDMRNLVNALNRDDWLGFDFPSQAINAVLTEDIVNFELSQGVKQSLGRLVNSRLGTQVEQLRQEVPLEDPITIKSEKESDQIETSQPITFRFAHNKDSATAMFGIPDRDAPFERGFEPSGKYMVLISESFEPFPGQNMEVGTLTLSNPLVVNMVEGKWKEELSNQYDGKTGKELSKAIIADGYDGIVTKREGIVDEIVDLTTFDESIALFQKEKTVTRGFYEPANSMIRLTEAADLSTFLHEFAHFMYEMELKTDSDLLVSVNNWYKKQNEAIAKEAMTFEEGITITPEEVNTFLDDNTTGNATKDMGIRKAVHEHFARGFETYLMEGKAPSIELRNAFRTFARWLGQIYRALRGNLNVELTDDMRQVFDRLLATDEQIAAAQARSRYEPLFTDATMAGMTEEQFETYQQNQEKMKEKSTETLREQLINEITRQTKKWWEEEKADVVEEQTQRLSTESVYRASDSLKNGEVKLDHATVKEMVGEVREDKLGRKSTVIPTKLSGMTAKGQAGVHPDDAAAFFGYGSGEEMIHDIVESPVLKDAAEQSAEQIMLDRHGDIMNDGTIEQRADEAVANEERGKIILQELKQLATGTTQPALERKTIKALAEERIGRLSFRDIHPGKYRKAEINAAQEAARMLAEGNREGAARAKAKQVTNYYLGIAATNAKNETIKIVDRMGRYNKKSVREAIIKAENGYWDQLNKILNRFEFRKTATLKSVDKVNQDINSWARERVEVDGDGLILDPAVLDETFVTHWKNVPHSDLQGINDSVKNIEHVARYSNRMRSMQEEIDFNKLVNKWVTSMNENVKSRFKSQRTTVAEGKKWGRWAMAQMTKIPFMASWLDGGARAGLSHDILVQPMTDAYNEELKMWDEVGRPVMDLINSRSKEDVARHNRKVFIPEIKDETNDGNLMGHQILSVALNTGNESNLRKLLLGEGWATEENEQSISIDNPQLQAVLARMTKSDWELVQSIWDQMELLYPQLAEVHRRTTGLTPPKIEATPIKNEFGSFRGGYYPIKYDPDRSFRALQNEDRLNAETESMFGQMGIQASVNASATNERTGYYAPIRLMLDVVPNHFQETIHYITHHDAIREVNKLIRNKEVANTISEKLGPEEFAQLKPWLNDIAKDGRDQPFKTFWGSILGRLRFGTTLGIMGFKASTGIIQISGLSNSMAELGAKPVLQAIKSILGSTTTMREAWEFAAENSKVLKHRTQTMDREVRNAVNRISMSQDIKTGNRWKDLMLKFDNSPFIKAAQEASMKHIALIQTYMVDLPTWHAAYIKEMEESGDEQKAYRRADWTIENIQGSGITKDMARVFRNQSEEARMFTMFMTFFSSLWNMERDLVKGVKSGIYSTSTVAAKGMFLFTLPVLFEMLMRGDLGGEDDSEEEEQLQKFLMNSALYPIQSVPFLRDIAAGVTGEFGYNISPLAQLVESGVRTIPEVVTRGFTDEEITKGQAKGATKFVGAATGIPGVNQMWATGEHMYEVLEEGEELTFHQLLFGPNRD